MKERGYVTLIFIFVIVLEVSFFVSGENVTTTLNITNQPPVLSAIIPNQSWPMNVNLTNAFDLDDYFIDNNGDVITYYFTSPANITVTADSGNVVSFYPDYNFMGTRSMNFIATDGIDNGTSNAVYLIVGDDSEPPQWSSPGKSVTTIYQNNYINFTTIWTDNVQLRDFNFYISTAGSNSSWQNLTGTYNVSRYEAQNSAGGGSTVSWYFCARDTNLNVNCTDVQNFTVASPPTTTSSTSTSTSTSSSGGGDGTGEGGDGSGGTGGGAGGAISGAFGGRAAKQAFNFTFEPDFFKVSLKQGESETRALKITNVGNLNITVNLALDGLQEFVLLSTDSIDLDFGEVKTVSIDFSVFEDTLVGQYNGRIILNSSVGAAVVPIVIDVNAREYEFEIDVNVTDDSKEVNNGDEVFAVIDVFNLRDIPFSEVTLYYAIKDFNGKVYDSGEDSFNLESALTLEKSLTLPEDAPIGYYLFYARLEHGGFAAIDSDDFTNGSEGGFLAFFKFSFFIILVVFLSAVAVVLFLRYRHERERERLLSLYMMLSEMKKMVKEGKVDDAVDLYVRIKSIYGEPVSKTALENKNKLKAEISKLSERLKEEVAEADDKTQAEIEGAVEKKGGEEKKEDAEKKENKEAEKPVEAKKEGEEKKEEVVKEDKPEVKEETKKSEETKVEEKPEEVKIEVKSEEKGEDKKENEAA